MRINGYNGIVKWSTIVSIKDNSMAMNIDLKDINSEDIAFVRVAQYNNIFCKIYLQLTIQSFIYITIILLQNSCIYSINLIFIVIRIDRDGIAFQIVGFQRKSLNSLFQYADVIPVSLESFMLIYNTDEQQYGLSFSDTSGIDLAYFVGNFDRNRFSIFRWKFWSDFKLYSHNRLQQWLSLL